VGTRRESATGRQERCRRWAWALVAVVALAFSACGGTATVGVVPETVTSHAATTTVTTDSPPVTTTTTTPATTTAPTTTVPRTTTTIPQWLDRTAPPPGFDLVSWSAVANYVNARPAAPWVAANVRWEAMPDAAAVAGEGVTGFVENGVVHLDTFCEETVTGICWQWDSDPEWVVWHEIGHVLPLIWGEGPAEERKAQCVAAAVLGRGQFDYVYTESGRATLVPDAERDALGYWQCDKDHTTLIRVWMTGLGVPM
jgi:hypothetical protein